MENKTPGKGRTSRLASKRQATQKRPDDDRFALGYSEEENHSLSRGRREPYLSHPRGYEGYLFYEEEGENFSEHPRIIRRNNLAWIHDDDEEFEEIEDEEDEEDLDRPSNRNRFYDYE
ncbi:MAG: hypothetical protein ACSNEK_03950 [Parachlamydiaceae bacterium]